LGWIEAQQERRNRRPEADCLCSWQGPADPFGRLVSPKVPRVSAGARHCAKVNPTSPRRCSGSNAVAFARPNQRASIIIIFIIIFFIPHSTIIIFIFFFLRHRGSSW